MRADSWQGLVTNASPFAIPPGSAVEQVNLVSRIPGQITTRGGMQRVTGIGATSGVLDCFPYTFGGKTILVTQRADGSLAAVESPTYGCKPSGGYEPNLSAPTVTTSSSYTYRYVEGSFDTFEPVIPDLISCGASECLSAADGGDAFTTTWTGTLDADSCEASLADRAIDGGTASAVADCSVAVTIPACGGTSVPSTTVPSAPRNLKAAFIGEGAILTWDVPLSDGGSPIIDYDVETSIDGGEESSPLPSRLDPPLVLEWLASGARVLAWRGSSAVPSDWTLEIDTQASTDGGTTWTGV